MVVVGYVAPLPGRNTGFDAQHEKLSAEVDHEMFTMLANHSAIAGELTQYALPMARGHVNDLARLRSMPEGALLRMCDELGMTTAQSQRSCKHCRISARMMTRLGWLWPKPRWQ